MRPFGRLRINASPRCDLVFLSTFRSTCLPCSAWNVPYVTTLRAQLEWFLRPSVVINGGDIDGERHRTLAYPEPVTDPSPLVDPFQRRVRDLRLSVTDRCNFRCTYCMPEEGLRWLDRSDLLTYEELARIARVCVERWGFDGIRITGGEPTIRHGLARLFEMLAPLGVDLAMTTNGVKLPEMAAELKAAGLTRVNVSLDSLRRETFLALTRRDELDRTLAGIDAALAAGLGPVKVNCVVIRDVNDAEIVDLAAFGREKGVGVRFIEFMPLDAPAEWRMDQVVSATEILDRINAVFPLDETRGDTAHVEPAARHRYRDGIGDVGVIPSVTEPFCESCDRVRITAEGKFRTCLFALDETDLRAVMRDGGSDDELAAAISGAVGTKWAGHNIGAVNFIRPDRSMSQIGG
ncbi:MAG: GTP 3',8-cyclase MoaA [Acidimicrobiia bacterium]|nr:GTP 3',8-cyclase MoaA [Acidimicrobiia bacterium]